MTVVSADGISENIIRVTIRRAPVVKMFSCEPISAPGAEVLMKVAHPFARPFQ